MTPRITVVRATYGTTIFGEIFRLDPEGHYWIASYVIELEDLDLNENPLHPHAGRTVTAVGWSEDNALSHLKEELAKWNIKIPAVT